MVEAAKACLGVGLSGQQAEKSLPTLQAQGGMARWVMVECKVPAALRRLSDEPRGGERQQMASAEVGPSVLHYVQAFEIIIIGLTYGGGRIEWKQRAATWGRVASCMEMEAMGGPAEGAFGQRAVVSVVKVPGALQAFSQRGQAWMPEAGSASRPRWLWVQAQKPSSRRRRGESSRAWPSAEEKEGDGSMGQRDGAAVGGSFESFRRPGWTCSPQQTDAAAARRREAMMAMNGHGSSL